MTLTFRIMIVVLIQTVILGLMIADRANILANGTPIVLKTEPIDPRSLFRGDYVTLTYDISQLQLDALPGDDNFDRGDKVFVTLEQDGEYWSPTGAFNRRPELATQNQVVVMAGRVDRPRGNATIRVNYGIDSYFVPEGEGRKIERALRGQDGEDRVKVVIAVSDNGEAAIKGLMLDSSLIYQERWL